MRHKYVRETVAGKKIRAYVVLNSERELVATVNCYDGDSTILNIFQTEKAACRSASRAGGTVEDMLFQAQKSMASGTSKEAEVYDGCWIDGHRLYGHSGKDEDTVQVLADIDGYDVSVYRARARKIGARCANYVDGLPTSCFYLPGLERLAALGYVIHQAI